jgi:hypothetical protein
LNLSLFFWYGGNIFNQSSAKEPEGMIPQCTHLFQTGAIVLAVQRVIYLVCDSLRKIQLGVADPNRPS